MNSQVRVMFWCTAPDVLALLSLKPQLVLPASGYSQASLEPAGRRVPSVEGSWGWPETTAGKHSSLVVWVTFLYISYFPQYVGMVDGWLTSYIVFLGWVITTKQCWSSPTCSISIYQPAHEPTLIILNHHEPTYYLDGWHFGTFQSEHLIRTDPNPGASDLWCRSTLERDASACCGVLSSWSFARWYAAASYKWFTSDLWWILWMWFRAYMTYMLTWVNTPTSLASRYFGIVGCDPYR